MPTGTPNLETIKRAVSARFPDAIYGQYNCRRRNGWNWSQHAGSESARGYRGNAIDIVHKNHGYGDTSPAHQLWLDRVNAFLVANRDALNLNELIWRKRNHFDHIHTSPWPKMHDAGLYVPPCKDGDLIVVYQDGTRGTTFGLPGPPPPPNMEDDMIRPGDTGPAVVHIQESLIAWDGPGILAPDGIDGKYGPDTTAGVTKFQKATGLALTQDGIVNLGLVDGNTAARLERYHVLFFGTHRLDQPGADGAQGEKGDQGDEGPQGPQGTTGSPGAKGEPGEGISTGDELTVTVQ